MSEQTEATKRIVYRGEFEQHIGNPFYPRIPTVYPNVPAEVPAGLADMWLAQPGWEEADAEEEG